MYGRRKKYAILSRQNVKKGTSTEELIFILYDNGVPVYEISNFLDVSIRHVEEVLSDD